MAGLLGVFRSFTLFNNDAVDNGERIFAATEPTGSSLGSKSRLAAETTRVTLTVRTSRLRRKSKRFLRGGVELAAATTTVEWSHCGYGEERPRSSPAHKMSRRCYTCSDKVFEASSSVPDDECQRSLPVPLSHNIIACYFEYIYSYNIHKCMCSIYIITG